jgi:glycosyltransferase A (GT-A) superfamily protein (DUF2064 family)
MNRVLDRPPGEGAPGAIAVGTDSPSLPTAYLRQACAHLLDGRADVVVGPCEDGGYYLIGLRAPAPTLFEAMPWSTSVGLEETLTRIRRLGLRPALLPTWFDVDRSEDLACLGAAVAQPAAGGPAFLRGLP